MDEDMCQMAKEFADAAEQRVIYARKDVEEAIETCNRWRNVLQHLSTQEPAPPSPTLKKYLCFLRQKCEDKQK